MTSKKMVLFKKIPLQTKVKLFGYVSSYFKKHLTVTYVGTLMTPIVVATCLFFWGKKWATQHDYGSPRLLILAISLDFI